MNKKGKKLTTSTVETGILFIVLVIVLFSIYATLVPEAQDAGDSLNDSNRCAAEGCFYNGSRITAALGNFTCSANNVTQADNEACGSPNTIPLSGLFAGSGVIFVALMAVILVIVILAATRGLKKKK